MKQDLKNYFKIAFTFFIITIPFALLRFPDIKNEMKYFIVTNNMLTDKNFFILKYFQELYPDKPPFYFWILSLIKIVSKEHFYFFNIFIGSTLFGFGILILTYKLIKNLKDSQTAFLITLSLETIPFFIGVSVLQRMDIMMSFFISLALYFFFGFYYNFCKISIKNLSIFYFSIFMGVFTKGVAGIAIPILVIFIFLILEKNLKFLKEIKFIRGFLFIIFLFGLWFYAISLSPNGNEYINLLLGQETVGRIVKSKNHIKPFYYYIKNITYIFYPYGLIFLSLAVIYIKKFKSWKNWESLEKISFISSIIPLIMFSLASGKLQIYLTPILQWAIVFVIFTLEKNLDKKSINFIFKLSEILSIFPIFFRKKDFQSRIKAINMSMFSILIFLVFGVSFYNKNYTLKPFENFLKREDIRISSYKFPNSNNLSYLSRYYIMDYNSKEEIPKDCQYLLKKNKVSDSLEDNYSLVLKNKKYSLYKKI